MGPDRLEVNEFVLRRAWESSQRSTPEDWAEWARHFAVELPRNSPSPALRANHRLAEVRLTLELHFVGESVSDLCGVSERCASER